MYQRERFFFSWQNEHRAVGVAFILNNPTTPRYHSSPDVVTSQLQAAVGRLASLEAETTALQQKLDAAEAALAQRQASLAALQVEFESLAGQLSDAKARHEQELAGVKAELAEAAAAGQAVGGDLADRCVRVFVCMHAYA